MPHAKPAVALGAAAIFLCGCGSVVKPPQGRGKVDDPRTTHPRTTSSAFSSTVCRSRRSAAPAFRSARYRVARRFSSMPSPGAAQAQQIEGSPSGQGAEVIGSALLFTHQGIDGELTLIENCLARA